MLKSALLDAIRTEIHKLIESLQRAHIPKVMQQRERPVEFCGDG